MRGTGGAPAPACEVLRLQGHDVGSSGALRTLLGVVADLRALGERLEAAALDRAVVDEQVLARLVGRDEAEALVVVEPLHGSGGHRDSLRGSVRCETRRVLRGNDCGNAGTGLLPDDRP